MSSGNGVGKHIQPSSTTSGGNGNTNRPTSKNRRKEKGGVNQFGRTFFHPPGGVSGGPMNNFDQANIANGPTLIDHN